MASSAELIVSIIGDMTKLKQVFGEVQTQISGLSQNISKIGKDLSSAGSSMTTGITAPILAVGAGIGVSISAASDFDTQMRRVATMLPGITDEGFGKIKQQSIDLSKQFGSDTADINNAMYQALSSGIPQDNIFEFMQTSEKLAIGGATDVVTAVDGLTSVVNSYGASQITAAHASDVMFQGSKLGKSTIEELSKQMADVVPLAASQKISFEDVNASLATMTIQGTRTAVATTQLKSMINELSQDTTQAGQAFKTITGQSFTEFIAKGGTVGEAIQIMNKSVGEYIPTVQDMNKFTKEFNDPASQMSQRFNELTGKSFQQFIKEGGTVQQAMKLMGVEGDKTTKSVADFFSNIEAKTGVLQLSGEGAKIYAADMKEMNNALGSTDTAYNTMAEGVGKSTDIMKADFKAFVIEAGNSFMPVFKDTIVPFVRDTLIPALEKMIPVIVSIMTAFGNLSPTLQLIVIGAIGLVAAIGPLLVIIGAVASGIGAIAGLFAAGGALAGAGAIISGLIAGITALGAPILILIGVVALLVVAWNRDWGGIREKAAAVWDWITSTAAELYNKLEYVYHAMIMSVSTLRKQFSEIWDQISSALSQVLNFIIGLFNTWYSNVQNNYNRIIALAQWLYSQFSGVWDTIKGYISQALDFIVSLFNTWYTNVQNNFNRVINAGRSLYTDLAKVWTDIENRFNQAKDTVIRTLQNLRNDAETEANNIVNKILYAFSNIKTSMEGFFNDVYQAGKNLVQNLIDGIEDMLPDLGGTVDKITSKVSDYLPMHSPARIGPLSTLPKWDDLFINPLRTSISKMGGTIEAGLNSMSIIGSNNNSSAVSNVYEGSSFNIGPNNISGTMDIQKIVDEINRRVTAQRRARGYIL